VFKRVLQGVRSARAISKMTAKKEWVWAWEIDKEAVMTLKMKVEA
jgi:hypothetical protein